MSDPNEKLAAYAKGDVDLTRTLAAIAETESRPSGHQVIGYEPLARVLQLAYEQSAKGKGRERHANGKPFLKQPLLEISRMVGVGGPAYQVCKKTQEAVSMHASGRHEAAMAEFLGAIVYAAACYIIVEEASRPKPEGN